MKHEKVEYEKVLKPQGLLLENRPVQGVVVEEST